MKRYDILYGIELMLFDYTKTQDEKELLDQLIEQGYLDVYCWTDNKDPTINYKCKYNVSQKGMLYYATQKSKSIYKGAAIAALLLLLLPLVFLWT